MQQLVAKNLCVIHELTVCFRGDVGVSSPTIVDVVAAVGARRLRGGRAVDQADRYSDVLDVAVAVPDEQLAAARDLLARLVVNVAATAVCTAHHGAG